MITRLYCCYHPRMFSLSGMHPRLICDGFEIAKKATLKFLETFKTPVIGGEGAVDKEMLKLVARTALRTKVSAARTLLCLSLFMALR